MVWRTVYRLLGRHDDALDCYQETFLAAYRASSGRPVEHWPSFLATLAARRAIDRLRSRVRQRAQFAPLDDVPEPVDAGDSPVDLAEGSERLEQVRILLAALPPKQAEVFWLACVEDLPHRAIADQMQIGAGEVRVLLHRARARLRAALGPCLPDPRTSR